MNLAKHHKYDKILKIGHAASPKYGCRTVTGFMNCRLTVRQPYFWPNEVWNLPDFKTITVVVLTPDSTSEASTVNHHPCFVGAVVDPLGPAELGEVSPAGRLKPALSQL